MFTWSEAYFAEHFVVMVVNLLISWLFNPCPFSLQLSSHWHLIQSMLILCFLNTGKVVHGETTTAHAVLNGMQYYHQDWAHAAAHVVVPPLRLDPSTPNFLMSLLGKYVLWNWLILFVSMSSQPVCDLSFVSVPPTATLWTFWRQTTVHSPSSRERWARMISQRSLMGSLAFRTAWASSGRKEWYV